MTVSPMRPRIISQLLLLILPNAGAAWILDASCHENPGAFDILQDRLLSPDHVSHTVYKTLVADSMASAFEMARQGQAGFTAIAPRQFPPSHPQPEGVLKSAEKQALRDLLGYIYPTVANLNQDPTFAYEVNIVRGRYEVLHGKHCTVIANT